MDRWTPQGANGETFTTISGSIVPPLQMYNSVKGAGKESQLCLARPVI